MTGSGWGGGWEEGEKSVRGQEEPHGRTAELGGGSRQSGTDVAKGREGRAKFE